MDLEYVPDLPPDLEVATAVNDSSAENADINKVECGLGNNSAAWSRPMFPTGRAIQVETGFGERLPSVDARPPRNCDSDAVIEDFDDNSDTGISDDDIYREDEEVDGVDKNGPGGGDEHCDGYPQGCDVMTEEFAKKRSSVLGSPHGDVHNKERERSLPERASSNHHSSSKDLDSIENIGSSCEDRLLLRLEYWEEMEQQQDEDLCKEEQTNKMMSLPRGHEVGNFSHHEAFAVGGSNSVRECEKGAVGSGRSYMFGPVDGAVFAGHGTELTELSWF